MPPNCTGNLWQRQEWKFLPLTAISEAETNKKKKFIPLQPTLLLYMHISENNLLGCSFFLAMEYIFSCSNIFFFSHTLWWSLELSWFWWFITLLMRITNGIPQIRNNKRCHHWKHFTCCQTGRIKSLKYFCLYYNSLMCRVHIIKKRRRKASCIITCTIR